MRRFHRVILAVNVTFLLFTLPMAVQAEQPTWEEMQALLGKPISDPTVKQFVAKYKLGGYSKFTSGGFDNSENSPVSLLYNKEKIERVIITVSSPEAKRPTFEGKLLLGLEHRDTPKDAIQRLGKPGAQPEYDNLSYAYKKFGLKLSFDRASHQLQEIDLDYVQPKIEELGLPYNKMDAKAIQVKYEQLAKKLNADLPNGWRATIHKEKIHGVNNDKTQEAEWTEILVSYKTPVMMCERAMYNLPRNDDSVPTKPSPQEHLPETFSFSLNIIPKECEQRNITHFYEGCPIDLFDPRNVRAVEDENFQRQSDEVLKILEKTLTKYKAQSK